MSGVSTRSRGQTTKPVLINLRKTDIGYKIEGTEQQQPSATSITIPKNVILKAEPKVPTNSAKIETHTIPSNTSAVIPTPLSASKKHGQHRTMPSQKATPTAVSIPPPSKTISPAVKSDFEPKKREIFPFTNFANPIPNPSDRN